LQGKELSYNNIADSDAAWECVKAFDAPACVIVKHANPCGVAVDGTLLGAYEKAFKTDSTSAFGGIIAFNGEVGIDVVNAMKRAQALRRSADRPVLHRRSQGLRWRQAEPARPRRAALARTQRSWNYKRVGGGLLVQTPTTSPRRPAGLKVVTKVAADRPSRIEDLLFAERVAKFVKSNAIVFCGNGMTLGVGAGQMSRVDSTDRQHQGRERRPRLPGSSSPPMPSSRSATASTCWPPAGAKAVIQPGGSMRDEEVIAAADEHGLAMVLTGARHFRH
jgi:phosphoribosylaminoimidazolecarboxamide formyltransferase/IMP cyclohydrolase